MRIPNKKEAERILSECFPEEYCSLHGKEGNPNCEECKKILINFCNKRKIHLTGDIKNGNNK